MNRRTFLQSLLTALALGPWLLDWRRKPVKPTSFFEQAVPVSDTTTWSNRPATDMDISIQSVQNAIKALKRECSMVPRMYIDRSTRLEDPK